MKCLLADDHKLMRDGLRAVLEREGMTVVGEAADGREAVFLTQQLRPDVVIMDVSMPVLNGIDATKRLVAEVPGIRVLALSMHADRRYVEAMLGAGAKGYLLKNAAAEELIDALHAVARGFTYVSPGAAAGTPARCDGRERGRPLSTREREVLQLLAEGQSSKEIARHLDVAVSTVESHRRQISEKLDLHSIAELTKYAVREGLTPLE